MRESIECASDSGPYSGIDWKRAEAGLRQIAAASRGAFYSLASTLDFSGIYDDIMENLKVRYMITYRSALSGDIQGPRTVGVELAHQMAAAEGNTARANMFFQGSYVPENRDHQRREERRTS